MNSVDSLLAHQLRKTRLLRLQDFAFEKLTLVFATTTLIALLGIIVSLAISAWPALNEFGFSFFYTIEWDIINSQFGGLIAIFGTVVTALIAIVIAVPLAAGSMSYEKSLASMVTPSSSFPFFSISLVNLLGS